ncbi:TetR family transcriptional regulator [Nonomuraea sp. K271]|nr:TetR family transcriptional regulator [Nonomuraea sp. K271]
MIVKSPAPTSRGRRTRAALVRAGREALEEHGYDAVRIDDVYVRAGVSHGCWSCARCSCGGAPRGRGGCRSRAWPTRRSAPG